MLADGHLIFILNKVISSISQNQVAGDGVKISKNKFLGILIVMLANISLTLF